MQNLQFFISYCYMFGFSKFWRNHHGFMQIWFYEIKFIYSKKVTKFCEIFTLLLSCVVPVKSKVKISQNFVAFSEYMNFKVKYSEKATWSNQLLPKSGRMYWRFIYKMWIKRWNKGDKKFPLLSDSFEQFRALSKRIVWSKIKLAWTWRDNSVRYEPLFTIAKLSKTLHNEISVFKRKATPRT